MNDHDENCEGCGENHSPDEVPFAIAEAARIVIEKATALTLDPKNPLNQILVMGAGVILEGIASGMVREQVLDFENLLVEKGE